MRYVRESKEGPYTSPTDHRRWLWAFRRWPSSLVVHFTGNSDATSFSAELAAFRADLNEIGFPFWIEVRRQHYVVSVASQAQELIDAVEAKVLRSWNAWCSHVPEIKNRQLNVERNIPA